MPPGTASAQTIDPQSPSGYGEAFSGPPKRSPSFLARVSLLTCKEAQPLVAITTGSGRIRKAENFTDGAPGRIGRRNWRLVSGCDGIFRYCRLTSPEPLLRNRATTSSASSPGFGWFVRGTLDGDRSRNGPSRTAIPNNLAAGLWPRNYTLSSALTIDLCVI
jgi:hypothetical protein